MPLETGTYIPDLNDLNPAHTDPQSQGDGHMRLIKHVLKSTFPNFTGVALSSTQAAIDAAVASVTGGTVTVGAGSAAAPSLIVKDTVPNLTTGLYSAGTNQLGFATAGLAALVLNADHSANFAGAVAIAGNLSVAGTMTGPGAIPPGVVVPFAGPNAPSGWLLCNGQWVSRTGTTAALFAAIGTTYGPGDGASSFAVPNLLGATVVGSDPSNTSGRGVALGLGASGGSATHQIQQAELPSHSHTAHSSDSGHGHGATLVMNGVANPAVSSGNNVGTGGVLFAGPVNNVPATVQIASGNANITTTIDATAGASTSTPIVQPSFGLNYIIKV